MSTTPHRTTQNQPVQIPAASHLIAPNHGDDLEPYADILVRCCFCGHDGLGQPASESIATKYFGDYDVMTVPDTGHICQYCAYCMDTREIKQGNWIATTDHFERVPTGELRDLFADLEAGVYDPPLAVKVADDPIRSGHAYLWTPVSYTTDPLTVCYDRQRETVTVDWGQLHTLLDAIEELRWHGFRLDDIREDAPRTSALESVGIQVYREIRGTLQPHYGTALLELAITLSRSAEDQDRDETRDGNTTLTAFQ